MTSQITDLLSDVAILTHLAKKKNVKKLEFILKQESNHLIEICKNLPLKFGPLVRANELEFILNKTIPEVHSIFEIDADTNKKLEKEKPKIKNFKLFDTSNPISQDILKHYSLGTIGTALFGAGFGILFSPVGLLALPVIAIGTALAMQYQFAIIKHKNFKKGSYYAHPHRTMNIELNYLEIVRNSIIHEYTHFLQHKYMTPYSSTHRGLMEGIARSCERLCANKIYLKEKKVGALFTAHNRAYGELKSTYQWLCDITGTKIKKELIKYPSQMDCIENLSLKQLKHPSPYALGNTFICLSELEFGLRIYPQLLRNNYEIVLDNLLN